jgi:small subunit ribosomal protein S19
MVKEYKYRGLQIEELQALSLEKLFELLPSRARRSLTRGITDGKRKLLEEIKSAKSGKTNTPIKTHLRDVIILPYFTGLTINVYSGKEFKPVVIRPEMVGHYLGEFVLTNKRVVHGAPGVGASRSSLYVPLK